MKIFTSLIFFLFSQIGFGQANFPFSFAGAGQRVCLVAADVDLSAPSVTLRFLDAAANTTQPTSVYRRALNGTGSDWVQVANALPPGTVSWTDNAVSTGSVWEYQVKRIHGSSFSVGYTAAAIAADQAAYRGRIILLADANIVAGLPARYTELKKDLTADGWYVHELIVPAATGWDSGPEVVNIRQQIRAIFTAAPLDDKPKQLFILGHVPMPRAGLNGQTPDGHIQNAGARGADTYYADIDGIFTDIGTYNPGGLSTPLAINLPGDYKWDQDNIPSALEMAFGRIDFKDITSYTESELVLTDRYLERLHRYKNVDAGFNMGTKSAFYFGYNNSNDGSYRSLPAFSGADSVFQNTTSLPHPQWVRDNGPFQVYMQNVQAPQTGEWNTYGMNAAIYSSDQSYWGFGDVPEGNQYSKIRSNLGASSKCVMVIWTTMAINIFHQLGVGESIGMSCKQIMDHNSVNQKLEKPSSEYDTPAWWNRTHFALWGDPTIRLFQVMPPSTPVIGSAGVGSLTIHWTASPEVALAGYYIYKSASEFGRFEKISPSLITGTSFTDNSATAGEWYMVRAIKLQKTGSGFFYNPSQGIFIRNNLAVVPVSLAEFKALKVRKSALLNWTSVSESNSNGFEIQRSADGLSWQNILFVPSLAVNGYSASTLRYHATDMSPFEGMNYYRLQSLSRTGLREPSEIRALTFDEESGLILYPNPVADILTFIITPKAVISESRIIDMQGHVVARLVGNRTAISVFRLKPGNYFLEVKDATGKIYSKPFAKIP